MTNLIAKNENVPYLSIGEIVDLISNDLSKLINTNKDLKYFPSTMLWGAPGVGKSEAIREIAYKLEENTHKKVNITDVRLLLFNPVDLRGIPTFNKDRTLSIWLKPKIFDMDPSDDVINILLLDEITSAPPSVQAAAYQITLDRKIGEHALPNNCIVFLAGNRISDRSIAHTMPKALANRLLHFEVKVDFNSFKKWAIRKEINDKVVGFLSFNSDNLMKFSTEDDSVAFATPRSWEAVSNILNYVDDDLNRARPLIAGLISQGLANEFISYSKNYSNIPNIEDIFLGKAPQLKSKAIDVLYALVSAMTSYAYKNKDDYTKIANSLNYADIYLPKDFSYLLLSNYLCFEDDYRLKLIKIPSIQSFIRKMGALLNGIQ